MAAPFGKPQQGSPERSEEARALMVALLMSQGKRELVAAHVFGGGLRLAPSLDDKMLLAEQVLEELEHFEVVAALFSDGRREQICTRRSPVLQIYHPRRRGPRSSWLDFCSVARRDFNWTSTDATLRKLCTDGGESHVSLQGHMDRWLRISLALFSRTDSEREQRAVELGLRPRESPAAIREYLMVLREEMSPFGLRIGLDLPGISDKAHGKNMNRRDVVLLSANPILASSLQRVVREYAPEERLLVMRTWRECIAAVNGSRRRRVVIVDDDSPGPSAGRLIEALRLVDAGIFVVVVGSAPGEIPTVIHRSDPVQSIGPSVGTLLGGILDEMLRPSRRQPN
ncbi:hypothetical protein LZC95_35580 [Pendulispora brunnea]|uniref:Uncharacterized protein n=1 Tax=Pendulispora brunnea TaxID=2905690 RepID=A0ABZ2K3P9_9BACT